MVKKNIANATQSLDDLLRSRYEGASNITGIRFQLLYSILRAFDFYADVPIQEIHFEGLEDIDVRGIKEQTLQGLNIEDTYIQVKRTSTSKTLSWLDHEKVLDHFIEVYLKKPDAHFVVVTSQPVKGNLNDLACYCHGQRENLPLHVDQKLREIATRAHLDSTHLSTFLRRISFQHMTEEDLLDRLHIAVMRSFDLNADNEQLYLSHLISCATGWAANRIELQKQHLEAEKIRIQEWISLGIENPAVHDRLIKPLSLAQEEIVDDFYEGKQTRPGHIIAALDAPRLSWQRNIEDTFKQVHVCIIRASSGQGKSTLLYRYTIDHFAPDTIYRLQVCTREEQIGPIVDYLRNRQSLGLPLLVLIDNLSYQTRLWYQVATALAGNTTRFLVTTREEDWYRYGLGASGLVRKFVEPYLSLQEARSIYNEFFRQRKIAVNVPSAEWAYEQVAKKRLLIEFVYLITHGHMLAERIEEQIATIEANGEDQSKLEVLRLIATAHMYNAHVSVASLLQSIDFQRDPDRTIKSLESEYITCIDGECEGLHFVRSEHLVHALHSIVPIQLTVVRLLKLLDAQNLVSLVASAFADKELKTNELIPTLADRCQAFSLHSVNAIIEALFLAGEMIYLQVNKQSFDTAAEQLGTWSLTLLAALTLPSGEVTSLHSLAQQYPDRPKLQTLFKLAQQMHPRDKYDNQYSARVFLEELLKIFSLDDHEPLAEIGQLCTWYHFFKASVPSLNEFLLSSQWEAKLLQSSVESVALFLQALYQILPDRYSQFITTHRNALFQRFMLEAKTLKIEEKGNNIEIEFIVDEFAGAKTPNDQAVWRLKLLHQLFPSYERYRSQGLYPSTGGQKPKVDDSHKDMTKETLNLISIHAPKNKLYNQLVEESYASLLAYDWEKQWDALRRTALRLAQSIIAQYELVHRGRQFNIQQIGTLIHELETLQGQILSPPNRLKEAFASQQGTMNEWESSLINFSRQFAQHNPSNPQEQNSRLMRFNLKKVTQLLPEFHQAFTALFEIEPDHFSMTALNEQESEIYSYLSNLLDYWFENRRAWGHHLENAVRKWQEEKRLAFAKAIREVLAPLAKQGMQFLYPTGPDYDHSLVGLCLSYEVIDFTRQIEQVALIVNAIASLDVEYDFLYLIPTVQKQQFGVNATRFTQQTVKQLAANEAVEGEIYPVLLPKDIHKALPDLDTTPLEDVIVVLENGIILASLVAEQNKLVFARSLLDIQADEEAQLFRYYEDEVKVRQRQLLDVWLQLRERAHNVNPGEAEQEWQYLWEQVEAMIEQQTKLDNISLTEIQKLITDLSPFDIALAKYMNRKYLGLASN